MPVLENGSRVGVVGGGPAGSFFACFLLETAHWLGRSLEVDVFEPRDLTRAGPTGCNMCGGVVSESLLQSLAAEGIILPPSIHRQGIDAYVLHTGAGRAVIEMPLREKRIVALYRGGGPGRSPPEEGVGLDAYLLSAAAERGATVYRERVEHLDWLEDRPVVRTRQGSSRSYDLLVGAVGVNTGALRLFEQLGFGYRAPRVSRAYACELALGKPEVRARFGSSFHVFLLDVPGLDFAALIPKGDHVTLVLLGEHVTDDAVERFLAHPTVRQSLPGDASPTPFCHCSPKLNVSGSSIPFGDRVVMIGDSAVTRLFKDGLGAAYRTAKAAVLTSLLEGVSAEAFRRGYSPTCRAIASDNLFGRSIFAASRRAKKWSWTHRSLLRVVAEEARTDGRKRVLSAALWDIFTGSALYRDLLLRTVRPDRLGRLLWSLVAARA